MRTTTMATIDDLASDLFIDREFSHSRFCSLLLTVPVSLLFLALHRFFRKSHGRTDGTNGWRHCRVRCDAVAASGETRSSRRKLEARALVRGTGRKTRRTRGEEYCILGGLCFRGERKSAYE